jgi:ribosomal protein S18 acetylase RimI-like enzyme
MTVTFRDATAGDADAVARVQFRSRAESYPAFLPPAFVNTRTLAEREAQWRGFLAEPGYGRDRFLVVADGSEGIVGFAAGGPQLHDDRAFPGEVTSIYLLRAHQRRGHGTRLMAEVARRLSGAGYPALIVWTQALNARSRAFYERLNGMHVRARAVTRGPVAIDMVAYGWPDLRVLFS